MTSQSRKRPAYLLISDALRDKIERNELEPGQRFPTERELVREFHVARMTVRHALDILEDEGLIDRRRGRSGGTYVRTVPPTLSLTKKGQHRHSTARAWARNHRAGGLRE